MLKRFYPYQYVDSVFSIDYAKLSAQGYKGLIFDIDNTLVHHGDDATPEVEQLFRHIHALGFKTLLLSNNSEERIRRFLCNIDSLYIHDAEKPKTDNYLKSLDMLGVRKEEALMIGDQIFTDILGANKSGIASILVRFIRIDPKAKIGKRRQLERLILACYQRNPLLHQRLGEIEKKS